MRATIACGTLLALACTPVRPVPPISVVLPTPFLPEVPLVPGTLTGRIVDDSTGQPLEHAMLRLVGSTRDALTDALGAFRIDSLPAGTVAIRTIKIGYEARQETLVVNLALGTTYEGRLRRSALMLDEGAICACDPVFTALRVRVLDATTNRPVYLPSIITVNLNTGEDSSAGRQPAYGDGGWASVTLRVGPYHVIVSAPGYRPWIRSRLEVGTSTREELVQLHPVRSRRKLPN